ncbi:MAG: flagellar protein FlaG [Treponema sp.]|nr:flagellar protein FlaG [Treponema sp.]
MGTHISSYTAGFAAAATLKEFPLDKRQVFPGDRRAAPEQMDLPITSQKDSGPPELLQAVTDLQRVSAAFNNRLQFVIDQDTRQILIKVIDNETDKVIKVLPPEELQRVHHRMKESIGFLFDQLV